MLVQLQGREVWYLQLNEAVSRRLVELMQERGMTQYQLYMKSGVPKSTIGNLVNCAYSPKWPDGKKHARNVYAHTREECEEKLKTLIVEMKAEIAEAKRLKKLEIHQNGTALR